MSQKPKQEKKVDDYDDDVNNYFDKADDDQLNHGRDKDSQNKHFNVNYYKNEHYDMAVDVNDQDDEEDDDEQVNVNPKEINNRDPGRLPANCTIESLPKPKAGQKVEEQIKDDHDSNDDDGEHNNKEDYIGATRPLQMTSPQVLKPLPKFDTAEFLNLQTTGEIKELLSIMNMFKPMENKLDTKMKPFIPSYVPAISEVDAFLKINRPDNIPEDLGLNIIDEPTINGIDKYILEMELAESTKCKIEKFNVKSIENAEKKPNEINDWIDKISDLRKRKLASNVTYSKSMPDIENLMQVWPEREESCLKEIAFPDEKIRMPLESYCKIICNMLDIPVHKLDTNRSLIESLHVLFTLYSGFKGNQHFQRAGVSKEDAKANFQSMKF